MSGVEQPAATPVGVKTRGISQSGRVAIAAVALAVAAVTVLAVVMQLYSSRKHDADVAGAAYLAGPAARAAEAAAVRDVTATLTYNYKTLSSDFANAEQGMTPGFRDSYERSTRTSVVPLATKEHAITTASVSASGVRTAAPNAVTVLVFANQTVQNSLIAHPRLDRTRIDVSMVKVDGKWLVDGLKPL
jgi:Mce-associated membrane protein